MINLLKTYDRFFTQNNFMGNIDNSDIFSYHEKNSKICFTAPHATKTYVCKNIKKSDLYTGAIVSLLGEKHNYSYITRNKYVPTKHLISDFIIQNHYENHFFLDIHGMRDNGFFDLAVGTGYASGDKYAKQIKQIQLLADKYNLSIAINHPSYRGCAGLVGRLSKTIPQANVLQLEWSYKYRDFYNNPDIVCQKTIPFLNELAEWLEH